MSPSTTSQNAELARINANLAQRIRIELIRQNLNIKQLAEATDIHPKTLTRRLHRKNPSPFKPGELARVSRHLGISIDDLTIGGEAA